MARKKKPYNLTRKIVVALRAIHRSWPMANQALRNAKVAKNSFRCAHCTRHFRKEIMRKDHTCPIGEEPEFIDGSWKPSWDNYINSFFSGLDNYQALCLDCHDIKTKEEKKGRKKRA